MMIYEYKCPNCQAHAESFTRADRITAHCQSCDSEQEFRRVFSISTQAVMQEHWNATVNKPISSHRQFVDELKRAAEVASLRTGMEHKYETIDSRDKEALGVTDEGVHESNRIRQKQGLPTFKI